MNITNFAKKLAEKPVFKTRIKSDQVKLPEIAIGYFLAPFCAMFANAIFGAYLNRYYVDVLGWTKFGAFATLLPIVSVIFVVLGNLMIGQWIDNTRSTQGKATGIVYVSTEEGGKPVAKIQVKPCKEQHGFAADVNGLGEKEALYFSYKGTGAFNFMSFDLK